jgi:hypothetical protein
MPDRSQDETPEETFRRLAGRLDLKAPDRSQWRAVCMGREREVVQRFLMDMAAGARAGSRADRLALYQAAHAVLPLHGGELRELAALLTERRPVPLEWCDALIEALAEQPPGGSPLAASVLAALQESCEQAAASPAARRRVAWIVRSLRTLRYRPAWAAALLPETE